MRKKEKLCTFVLKSRLRKETDRVNKPLIVVFHGEHGVIFIARTINEFRLDGDCETIIIKAHLSIRLL